MPTETNADGKRPVTVLLTVEEHKSLKIATIKGGFKSAGELLVAAAKQGSPGIFA